MNGEGAVKVVESGKQNFLFIDWLNENEHFLPLDSEIIKYITKQPICKTFLWCRYHQDAQLIVKTLSL
jgi:hypothetical protein